MWMFFYGCDTFAYPEADVVYYGMMSWPSASLWMVPGTWQEEGLANEAA